MDDAWQAVARLADADRALRKELQRCYGARAADWLHATHHDDPTMQGIANEHRAAAAAYARATAQPTTTEAPCSTTPTP